MALILLGLSKCSLCGVALQGGDEIVSTSHFIADRDDPLWRFSDSGMHKSCFLSWEQRDNFVKKYNETRGAITWGNETYHHMEDDGEISVLKREDGTD